MELSAQAFAEYFELEPEAVLSYLKSALARPDLALAQSLVLEPPDYRQLVDVLASNAAKCRSCSRRFEVLERSCSCGRALGRCPKCMRYGSFLLAKKCWIGRDEYRCDLCTSDVAVCGWGNVPNCYRWAAKEGSSWLSFCHACEFDPARLEDARRTQQLMTNAFTQSLQNARQDQLRAEDRRWQQWQDVQNILRKK